MSLALSEEKLSPEISLWRVYASKEIRDRRGPYVGAFVLVADGSARVAKGFVVQKPLHVGMTQVREIAEQLAKITGADTLVLERHGRWIRVDLFNLKIQDEEKTGICVGACSSDARMGDDPGAVRLE